MAERDLDNFLSDYRVITIASESNDLDVGNIIKRIFISVEQKEKTPSIYFSRGIVPFNAPSEDTNAFIDSLTGTGEGLTYEHASFKAGVTYLQQLGLRMAYDMAETRDAQYGTIGYRSGGRNMYGAFKILYDNQQNLLQYPYFYGITGSTDIELRTSFTGITEKGASGGVYTIVNFGGVLAPFQLMIHPETLGLTHSNGIPTGTASNPLFFGLTANTDIDQAVKSLYFTPDIHFSLRRSINIYRDWGVTFDAYIASFEPHYQFVKYADDIYANGQTDLISTYLGSTGNPAWISEILRTNGTTVGARNLAGYLTAEDFNNRFFNELVLYPKRYKFTKDDYNIGHYGIPYATEAFGWVKSIPTPGTATDGTGPYASIGANTFLNRIAGLTFYPPPEEYNYKGATGSTAYLGTGGSSGWNTYHRSLNGATTSHYPEFFMLGGPTHAASSTYEASWLLPANIMKLSIDAGGPVGLLGKKIDCLEAYYLDIYTESLKYSGFRNMNFFPVQFIPRFNPLFPMQEKGTFSENNQGSRRDCTIHKDFGGTAEERLFNLKESLKDTIHASMKTWKLLMDQQGKYDYRIMPVVRGRNEDLDLTRGGSVPYSPSHFVEYLIAPLFSGSVPANGFIIKDDIDRFLMNGFYNGNIKRGSSEYSAVVTNGGISGTDETTAFIRGLETYFFDLQKLQHDMRFASTLQDLGITASAANHSEYLQVFNSGRFSDYRVFESNVGTSGGNTKIPYGFGATFNWYTVPLREGSIMTTNSTLKERWQSDANNNRTTAYKILRDAYFELSKKQVQATQEYFKNSKIVAPVQYRNTDRNIGRTTS